MASFQQNSPPRAPSSSERILQAAKHLFAERGYENTSTVAIARAAGTSESQLMKHFGSKEGLLEAIFEAGWQRLAAGSERIRQLPSAEQKLRAMLEATLGAMEGDAELKRLLLLEGRRIRKEGNMVMTTGGFLAFVGFLDEILVEMRSQGQLRQDLNPAAVRSALIGMFEGLMRDQLLAERTGFPAQSGPADLRKIFDAFIPALR